MPNEVRVSHSGQFAPRAELVLVRPRRYNGGMAKYEYIDTPIMKRARRLFRERIEPEVGDELNGQWVVIDANSGEYEMGDDPEEAVSALKARIPDYERVFYRDGEFIPGHLGGYARVLWESMPQESKDSVPHDGSLNLDHYLYGYPKRDKYPWEE